LAGDYLIESDVDYASLEFDRSDAASVEIANHAAAIGKAHASSNRVEIGIDRAVLLYCRAHDAEMIRQ